MNHIEILPWPTIYIMVGIPGSGKSTWAREQAADRSAVIVSRDAIRGMLTGSDKKMAGSEDFEAMVTRIEEHAVESALWQHSNVILDATNLRVKDTIKRMDNAARSVLYPHGPFPNIIPVRMDTPLLLCLERNAAREDPVPEHVIMRMHERMHDRLSKS